MTELEAERDELKAILTQLGYYGDSYYLSLNLTEDQFNNLQESIAAWQENDPGATVEQIVVGLCDLGRVLLERRKSA